MQLELLPLDVLKLEPPASITADIDGIATAVDGMQYAAKSVRKYPLLPATEWACSSVSQLVHVPVPSFQILKLPTGELMFGSRWEGGVFTGADLHAKLDPSVLVSGASIFARIYALDLFLHNVDRHINNYLFRDMNGGVGVLAMDFSRALLYHDWPLPNLPMDPTSHTMMVSKALRAIHGFDLMAAHNVLDALGALPDDAILRIVRQMPAEWLGEQERNRLVAWWCNGDRADRVSRIKGGLDNGQYL